MKVKFRGKEYEVEGSMRVKELLQRFDLLPEYALVVRNDEILTEDELVREDDEVMIITAISGG